LQTLETWRYGLTDALDDLADLTDRYEIAACAAAVLEQAGDLVCTRANWWIGRGKWLPRRLLEADSYQGGRLLKGFCSSDHHSSSLSRVKVMLSSRSRSKRFLRLDCVRSDPLEHDGIAFPALRRPRLVRGRWSAEQGTRAA
jgi:hypothetical protein